VRLPVLHPGLPPGLRFSELRPVDLLHEKRALGLELWTTGPGLSRGVDVVLGAKMVASLSDADVPWIEVPGETLLACGSKGRFRYFIGCIFISLFFLIRRFGALRRGRMKDGHAPMKYESTLTSGAQS